MNRSNRRRPAWVSEILAAASAVLVNDRDLAIIIRSDRGEVRLHDKVFSLRQPVPGEMERRLLNPYFATAAKIAQGSNHYVAVRYDFGDRNKIAVVYVYIGADTILATQEVA